MLKLDDIASNRVVGVLAAYVVIALAALEGLDVLQEALGFPPVVLTVAAVAGLVGLPVAAAWAWYTDPTRASPKTTSTPQDDTGDEGRLAPGPTRAWRVAGLGAIAAAVVLATGWWYSTRQPAEDRPLDRGTVAVMPFGTGGAHPDLAWLEQGAMDLLAAKLSGDYGPRAMDPRAVLSRLGEVDGDASEQEALAGARRLGAGFVLTGSVVGSPDQFTLNATLHDVDSGAERSRASVQASVDSLAPAADRLVITLLSLDAGEARHRLAALTSTDPTAVRFYLEGQALYRQGRYEESLGAYDRALDMDSTFALAGIGLASAAAMTLDAESRNRAPRGRRLALAARENLSPTDRRFVELWADANEAPTWEERRAFRERAVRELPDRPELWYLLGDLYAHWGTLLDVSNPLERAERAFHRAVELDSLHFVAIQHLGWLAAYRGDTAEARHYVSLQEDLVEGEPHLILEIDRAAAHGDTAAMRRLQAEALGAGTMGLTALVLWLYDAPVGYHVPPQLADSAVDRLVETATSTGARIEALALAHDVALNGGRPAEANRLLDRIEAAGGDRVRVMRQQVYDALYWRGDSTAAADAVDVLERELGSVDPLEAAVGHCALLQWHAHAGAARPEDRRAIAAYRAAEQTSDGGRVWADLCLALGDAVLAWKTDPPGATAPIQALDSILAMAPSYTLRDAANVALARILGDRGSYERAAQVAGRIAIDPSPEDYWSSLKFEQGRWAERTGDLATAREAYADWLRVHHDPEPAMQPMVDEVRRRLATLAGEGG